MRLILLFIASLFSMGMFGQYETFGLSPEEQYKMQREVLNRKQAEYNQQERNKIISIQSSYNNMENYPAISDGIHNIYFTDEITWKQSDVAQVNVVDGKVETLITKSNTPYSVSNSIPISRCKSMGQVLMPNGNKIYLTFYFLFE